MAFGETRYLKYYNIFEWAAMARAEFLLGASLVLTELEENSGFNRSLSKRYWVSDNELLETP